MIYRLCHKSVVLLEEPQLKTFKSKEEILTFIQQFNLDTETMEQLVREGNERAVPDGWDNNKKLGYIAEYILAGNLVVTQRHDPPRIKQSQLAPVSDVGNRPHSLGPETSDRVPNRVESFSTNAAFDGKLYPDKKIDQLVPYLEKRGVTVMETRGNPSFTGNWDGTGVMKLPVNPTELQVKHELSHFIDFRNQIKQAPTVRDGVQNFVDMGRLGREQSVLDHLQNNRMWNQLNNAERSFSIDYVERLRIEAGQ